MERGWEGRGGRECGLSKIKLKMPLIPLCVKLMKFMIKMFNRKLNTRHAQSHIEYYWFFRFAGVEEEEGKRMLFSNPKNRKPNPNSTHPPFMHDMDPSSLPNPLPPPILQRSVLGCFFWFLSILSQFTHISQ